MGVAGDVVHLAEYRRGKRAVWALVGLLHEPPWLQKVYLECGEDGVKVVAIIREDNIRFRMCFPASIDGIPVEVRVKTT